MKIYVQKDFKNVYSNIIHNNENLEVQSLSSNPRPTQKREKKSVFVEILFSN
jgi:hypothetical protein